MKHPLHISLRLPVIGLLVALTGAVVHGPSLGMAGVTQEDQVGIQSIAQILDEQTDAEVKVRDSQTLAATLEGVTTQVGIADNLLILSVDLLFKADTPADKRDALIEQFRAAAADQGVSVLRRPRSFEQKWELRIIIDSDASSVGETGIVSHYQAFQAAVKQLLALDTDKLLIICEHRWCEER